MHTVSEDDLEAFLGAGDGLYIAAFGIAVGGLISTLSTLSTISIVSPISHAMFVAMAWVCGFAAVITGLKVIIDRRALAVKLHRYKEASKKMSVGSGDMETIDVREHS